VKWGSLDAFKKHPGIPVYLRDKREDMPDSIAFPFEDIAKKFQIFDDRSECMMTNSISWMIALALDEGFDEIHVYGVNMSHSSEYGFQKPSCEYYLGLANGRGKKIYVPTESDLCKSFYLYGRDEEKQGEMLIKLEDRFAFLQSQHTLHTNNQAVSRDMMNKFVGALEQWEFLKKNEQARIDTTITDQKEREETSLKVMPVYDVKIKEITDEYNKHRTTYEQSRDAINQHIGAIEDVKFMQLLMKQ
jgi:hypothetical protein